MSQKVNVELVRHRAREIRESLDKIRVLRYARENLDDFEQYLFHIGQFVGREL